MCREAEWSTAIRAAGTRCVPVAGMREGRKHELSAGVWAILMVQFSFFIGRPA